MRNIADIIADDKNGKNISQTERQIAVAYIQGKYDAVMELKNINNSNDMEVLNRIRDEIKAMSGDIETIADVLAILDKYKAESEDKK